MVFTHEKTMVTILQSSPPLPSGKASCTVASFLQDATGFPKGPGSRSALLRIKQFDGTSSTVLVWVHWIHGRRGLGLEEAAKSLQLYLESPYDEKIKPLMLPFWDSERQRSSLLVANVLESSIVECLESRIVEDPDAGEIPTMKWALGSSFGKSKDIGSHSDLEAYPGSSARTSSPMSGRPFRVAFLLAVFVFIAIFSFSTNSTPPIQHSSSSTHAGQSSPSTTYIRYPTGDSVGPKYQLRIQWHNASDWVHTHPHNNGEWAFRMDDQALIPAHLYDEDEDSYQQWFRQRYPHMTQVADRGDYVRPSWLGSREVAIEWDSTFHDAHCILAFRRYFKAKESGRHVCARDIHPGHIKHCLDKLDSLFFKPGEMTGHDPKQYMYWQTKVCFGEEGEL